MKIYKNRRKEIGKEHIGKRMTHKIVISGSYGGLNLGDEAILEGILKELKSKDIDVTVFSRNAPDTEKRHGVRALPITSMHKDEVMRELKKLDLFILGGGGILFDGIVEQFLRDVTWALELNIPVMIYAISAGPLRQPESRKLVAEVLNKVKIITVRDSETKRMLHDLGVTQEIEVTADPAFLIDSQSLSKENLKKEGINSDEPLIGMSVREPGLAAPDLNIDHYHTLLANAADFMVERYNAQILFIPMEARLDPQQSHAVISKMSNAQKASVLKGEYTAAQILGLAKNMEFAVGMRLHFLIFAAMQNVPFVPLPYASKVQGLLQDLAMPITPIEEWNSGKLCAVIDRAWDSKKRLQKQLEIKAPLLKEKAKQTSKILFDFIKTIKPKKN